MIIEDEKKKKAIISALLDEYSRKILFSTIVNSKSVTDIMREQGIPMTSTYRKVKVLIDNNLMVVEKSMLTEEGKRYYLYRSKIKNASLIFEDGDLIVDVTTNLREKPEDKLMRSFVNIKEARE